MIELKGGHQTQDRRLDRVPQFDPKSRKFNIQNLAVDGEPLAGYKPRGYTWAVDEWLDQGSEGRCVEYSICHDLVARPKMVPRDLVEKILEGRRIYWPAQQEDEWEGGSYAGADPQYEGTSVLAGIKVAARLGFYLEYRWAFTLEGAVLGLGYVGPLVLGVNWYEGMYNTDADGWLNVTGELAGGHAILANAVKLFPKAGTRSVLKFEDIDIDRSYITLHNSWGPAWGVNGRGKLSLRNFDQLRREYGEVCVITKRLIPKTLPGPA